MTRGVKPCGAEYSSGTWEACCFREEVHMDAPRDLLRRAKTSRAIA